MWILDNPYNPFLLLVIGAVLAIAAFVAWIQTGHKAALYAAVAIAAIFAMLVITERMMVSDREAIEAMLRQVALDLQKNDRDAVYVVIHPKEADLIAQAKSELPNYTFSECRVTQIQSTKIDAEAKPKTAVVEFIISAKGTFKVATDIPPDMAIARFIRLNLEQDTDGKWKVVGYTHAPVTAVMRQEDQ